MSLGLSLPFALVGLGATGRALIRLFEADGLDRKSYATFDSKDLSADYIDSKKLIEEFQPKTLVVSPGVPLTSPWIVAFKKSGGQVSSEFEICSRLVTSERVVAVTGSIGKSTCTSLLGEAFKSVDEHAFVGGNLGLAWANYFADLKLGLRKKSTWMVIEVSSFQIEGWGEKFSPEAVVLTYLSPNHLERYESLAAYYNVKWSLVRRAQSKVFLNFDCPAIVQAQELVDLAAKVTQARDKDFDLSKAQLLGDHNKQNLSLALHVCDAFSLGASAQSAVLKFRGLSHRCENLGERHGILFINDSKATAIDSVQAAVAGLESMRRKRGGFLWVCLGGRDKKLPWADLRSIFKGDKVQPIFFGECGPLVQSILQKPGPFFTKLADATSELPQLVKAGDIVLLSPGGTSLDEFKNFEDRGSFFKDAIKRSFA